MKVASLESDENTKAEEKKSFASRLLVVLIRLNFVPVKLDQNGKAIFRLFSFRYVLSVACWYLPFLCFYAFYMYVAILAPVFQYGLTEIYVIQCLSGIAGISSYMLMAISLPYCLGYLVGHSELLIPMEIAPTNLLKLVLIWAIAVTSLFLPEIIGTEATGILFCHKIFFSLLILEQQICLGILKIISYSFKRKCEQLKTSGNFYKASTRTLDLYKSIKTGAGPFFFVLYSYGTLSIIIDLFMIIAGYISIIENFMGMFATLLGLYEISAYGQELYENICASAMLVR